MLSLLLATALAAPPGVGPLTDKPLPELALSHSLQGDTWSQTDLLGSVVVLDVFQLG